MTLDEIVAQTRKHAELDDARIAESHLVKRMAVGAERVGNDECVATIIFRTRSSVSIAKTIDLLRIDRKHARAVLDESLGGSGPPTLDADHDVTRCASRQDARHHRN